MFYTSGTTGRPKGVRSTSFAVGMPCSVHATLLAGLAGMLHVPEGGVCLVNAPIYHGGPFLFSMLPAYKGATLVIRRRFDGEEMLRLIDEYRVTTAYSVPTHFVRLLRLPDEVKAAFDGSSLEAVFHTGAPCAPEVKRQMLEWWGPVIHELYSATETGGLGCFVTGDEWLTRPGTRRPAAAGGGDRDRRRRGQGAAGRGGRHRLRPQPDRRRLRLPRRPGEDGRRPPRARRDDRRRRRLPRRETATCSSATARST